MIDNYLKVALRAIKNDKQHFLLNLIGFSIGLAAAMLMALFAQHEMSYDKQHHDSERVYLAHADFTPLGLQAISMSSFKLANSAKQYSQVQSTFMLTGAMEIGPSISDLVELDGNLHRLHDFYAASSNILDFVDLKSIYGNITQALTEPNKLVLSEREAIRIFGYTNVTDRVLSFDGGQYTVGAVFENLPENTHFKFESLINIPNQTLQKGNGYVYYKVEPDTDIAALTELLTKESHRLAPWFGEQNINILLVNMEDLHFTNNNPASMKSGGSKSVLQICIGLSVIIIIIASFNFINLTIAQSAKRAKEVGIRKALGATKFQLIKQFLTESLLVVSLAGLIAFALVEVLLPDFNLLMDRNLSLHYGSTFMWLSILTLLIVGLLSGLYPAIFIASFSAKRVLSGDLVRGSTAIFVRKLTLCLQGALSIGLIIGAIFLYQQMQLIDFLKVGYEKSSRLVIKGLPPAELYKKEHNSLFTAIRNLSGVEQVTASNTEITNDMTFDFKFVWPNGEVMNGMQPTIGTSYYPVETLGLKLLAGRDFSPQHSSDWFQQGIEGEESTVGVLVSRRMVELAGYQDMDEVIGFTLFTPQYGDIRATVVGVIEDVKIGSARQQSLPMSVNLGFFARGVTADIVIKANNTDLIKLSDKVKQLINDKLHLSDVTISLLSDDYDNAHKNEHQALDMVTLFSLLAIFLTCLGTFGLASFSTLRRQKEIAMRKVLGASRLGIVNLLAKEFLLLIFLSIVIAFPLSYWLLSDWLANFNDRIEQSIWVYFASALTVTSVTWLTVASLAFKAASTRPSLILRDE